MTIFDCPMPGETFRDGVVIASGGADGGCFVVIPTGLLEQARQIPGITLARPTGEVYKCGGW